MPTPTYTNADLARFLQPGDAGTQDPNYLAYHTNTTTYVPQLGDPDYYSAANPSPADRVKAASDWITQFNKSDLGKDYAATDATAATPTPDTRTTGERAFDTAAKYALPAAGVVGGAIAAPTVIPWLAAKTVQAAPGALVGGALGATQAALRGKGLGDIASAGLEGAVGGGATELGLSGMGSGVGKVLGWLGGKAAGEAAIPAAEAVAEEAAPTAAEAYESAMGGPGEASQAYRKAIGQPQRLVNPSGQPMIPGPKVGTMSPPTTPAQLQQLRVAAGWAPTTPLEEQATQDVAEAQALRDANAAANSPAIYPKPHTAPEYARTYQDELTQVANRPMPPGTVRTSGGTPPVSNLTNAAQVRARMLRDAAARLFETEGTGPEADLSALTNQRYRR